MRAAYEILAEKGLGGFSIDAVALRAGVARTTIYRWWPSRGLLATESFLEAVQPRLTFPRTACAASDMRALLHSMAEVMRGPAGRIVASIVAEAQGDAETQRQFLVSYSTPLRRESLAMLQAGIDRGQFRADLAAGRVIDAAIGALYYRLLFGQDIGRAWVEDLADTLLAGCWPAGSNGGSER